MNAVVPNPSLASDSVSEMVQPHSGHIISLRTPRPIRLASTKHLSRDEWLQLRKQGIGSSDAAAAVGLCIDPQLDRTPLN